MKKYLFLLVFLFNLQYLTAQDNPWTYKWSSHASERNTDDPGTELESLKSEQQFNNANYLILRFDKLPAEAVQATMKMEGFEVLGYLGDHHYWTRIDSEKFNYSNLLKYQITDIAVPHSQLKHNPVTDKLAGSGSIDEYAIRLWSADDLVEFSEWLIDIPSLQLLSMDYNRKIVVVKMSETEINTVTDHPAVGYLGPHAKKGIPLIDNGISMVKTNVLQNPSVFGKNLSGNGVRIGMWDDGLTGNHIDINPTVINVQKEYYGPSASKHPTHVASLLTGKGHKWTRVRGMAPNSEVFAWSFNGDIISEMNTGIANYGLNIINSSFFIGEYNDPIEETMCAFPAFYVLESSEIDQMIRDNPGLTHVIANGNQHADCQAAGYWSGIPIGLQSAKNAINVGWVDVNEIFWGGSSVGPTSDGRLKPELMAKGARVLGADINNGYHERWGSSGSAPTTAGSIALLYEWYFDNNGSYPNSALTRAIMCNTAFDMFFTGPDYFFGFGRVNSWRAFQAFEDENYVEDVLSDGEDKSFTIEVPAGISQLNVLVAWSDKEAIPGALKTLVNDIDLKVTGPSATEYLPWVLDPAIPFFAAVTGRDSVNNVEKVSIFDPVPGTYSIDVSGREVPFGPQEIAVTYDMLETGITITHPIGGESWMTELQYIRWDAFGTGDNFSVDISYDDGGSWENIGNPAGAPLFPITFFAWSVKDTTTHVARMRVSSGGYESISGPFTIMRRANPIFSDPCDRQVEVYWDPVRDADDYIVQMLVGNDYIPIDTTADTSFVINGLENGEEYWVAVTARDGANLALRSNGIPIVADGSNCNLTNDIAAYNLCRPLGFRYTFDGSLPYNESLQVVIRNYSSSSVSSFNVCYERDGGGAICEPYVGTLGPNAVDTFTFSAVETFGDTLTYDFKIYTTYASDTNPMNDSLTAKVKVVPSHPNPLPYYNNFESPPSRDYISKYFAIDGMEEWDFEASSSQGRMSVSRLEQFAQSGVGCFTLDRYTDGANQSSYATLNLNLTGHNDSTIYLDFSFLDHGDEPQPEDKLWARANDSEAWVKVIDLGSTMSTGNYQNLSAFNLSKLLIADNGQSYGDNFQLRVGQSGSQNATFVDIDDGRSVDNIKIYTVGQDIALFNLIVQTLYCDSIDGELPVSVIVFNSSMETSTNIPISLKTDSGFMLTDTIPSLGSHVAILHTFSTGIPYSPGDVIELEIYSSHVQDRYPLNDSILDIQIVIQPFGGKDYYEDFEGSSLGFHDFGTNSTWEKGEPVNDFISEAASGNEAWVTNLSGRYRNLEDSYVITPCFDFSDYTNNPNIAFNLKLEIEEDFDKLSFEYSEDGMNWQPMSTQSEAYNWFNGGGAIWDVNVPEWKTTSNNLDLAGLTDPSQVIFRYIIYGDQAVQEEGAGIDDMHVTEDTGPVFSMAGGQATTNPTLAVGPSFNPWLESGEIVAAIQSPTGTGTSLMGVRKELAFQTVSTFNAQSRHFWLTEDLPYRVRLYLPYDEYGDFFGEFPDWQAPFRMGVLAYKGPNIDDSPGNNSNNYHCVNDLQIKPYRDGYIFEFDHNGPGEFFIVENSPCADVEFVDAEDLVATAITVDDGLVEWTTTSEINIAGFLVEAGPDSASYDSIGYQLAVGADSTLTNYAFTDSVTDKACVMCYRVYALTLSGDSVLVGEDTASFIFAELVEFDSLDAVILTGDDVKINWGTHKEKCNDYFEISVSVNSSPFTSLGTIVSSGESNSWTSYDFLDDSTPKMDTLCYRVDQYFIDASSQSYGPVCVIFADSTADSTENVVVGSMAASALDVDDGLVEWTTLSENGIAGFIIEAGEDSLSYDSIAYVIATGTDSTTSNYEVTDSVTTKECTMCYRVWAITISGDTLFVGDDTASFIFPSLVAIDSLEASVLVNDDVQINWGTLEEKCNDYFEILVSVNGSAFNSVGTVPSSGESSTWTPYNFLDDSTPKNDTLCYQLNQYFIDGSSQSYGPVCVEFPADTTADTSLQIISIVVTDVDCFGGQSGAIDITVIGGLPPYLIRWSNGAESEDVSSLEAGEYIVSVEDASNEIIFSDVILVLQPDPLTVDGGLATDVLCTGTTTGMISGIAVSGGTPPYSYSWSNGDTTLDIENLSPDTYQLTVTDDNGCTTLSAIYVIEEPLALSLISAIPTDVECYGATTGAIDIEVGGGSPLYSYLWSNGDMTQDISDLGAGDYSCTITDDNGCILITPDIAITEPTQISISSAIITNADCFGASTGSINISVSGGSPQYFYLWSNGMTTQDIADLPAGDYTVEITDANDCVFSPPAFTITQPDLITFSFVEISDVSCNGGNDGSINIEVEGGNPPYVYSWSNGSAVQDIDDLSAGDYSCTVTDANGCQITSAMYTVNQPDELSVASVIIVNNTCWNDAAGSIDIEISGGTPDYSYLWSSGEMTQDIELLSAGDYSLMVTDMNGCELSTGIIQVTEPDALVEATAVLSHVCAGDSNGMIDITLEGGMPPYEVLWSNGAETEDVVDLAPGQYSYTAVDANGCVFESGVHEINESALTIDNAEIDSVACFGESSGSISITVTGGPLPLTYQWSNGASGPANDGLIAGDYTVEITDAYGCTVLAEYTVSEPDDELSGSIEAVDESSSGASDGSVTVTVNGGIQPYNFNWSTGQTTQNLIDVVAADYCVTITDDNACELKLCATVGVGTAVIDLLKISELILFPNPTGDVATLKINLTQPASLTVSLVDVSGKVIQSMDRENTQDVELDFDVRELAAGTYLVSIKIGDGFVSLPLVVQH